MSDSGGAGHVSVTPKKFSEINDAWEDLWTKRKLIKLLAKLGVIEAKNRAGIIRSFNGNDIKVPGVY